MLRHILPIARYTLLEALRNRLLWLALILVAAGLAFTQFLQQVAITESNQIQAALLAALLRVGAVFMLARLRRHQHGAGIQRQGDGADSFAAAAAQQLFFRQAGGLRRGRARARADSQPAARAVCAGAAGRAVGPVARVRAADRDRVRAVLRALADAGDVGACGRRRLLSALALDQRAADHGGQPFVGRAQPGPKTRQFHHRRDRLPVARPGPHDPDRLADLCSAPTPAEIMQVLAQTAVYVLLLCGAALFDLQRKNF